MSSSSPSPAPPSTASVALCEHVQREGLGSHIFSDITVAFQSKEYKLHRIILSQSSYFRSLFSGPWKECGKPRVELQIDDQNVTVEGLEATIAYLYGLNPTFTGGNVVGILAAGCFLCMESLCEQCVKYMVDDLREETFVTYQHLSEHNCYGQFADRIRDACWSFLCAHGARELAYVLPKLSLQLLCRLLKSDELWVVNESERYKLAKQAVLNWKLARSPSTMEGPSAKKAKSKASKKLSKNAAWQANKNQKSHKLGSREKTNKKKDAAAGQRLGCQQRDVAETALRKLRRLWGEDTSAEASKEGFDVVVDLFTGGGIIFAYMEAEEALQARKELEDANMPIDVVNDSIWQNVLLKARVKESEGPPAKAAAASDEEEEEDEDDEEEEEEEEEEEVEAEDEEDDVEYDEDELSSSDDWSDESGSTSSSNSGSDSEEDGSGCSKRNKRLLSTSLVTFSTNEPPFDGKRRKTTGGFSWAVKLDTGMQLSDFPPFRFGAEFMYRDRRWVQVAPFEGYDELERKEVFYGGSLWKIVVSKVSNYGCPKDEWSCTVQRRAGSNAYEGKKVTFTGRLFVKTKSGLQSAAMMGGRSRDTFAMLLHGNEIVKEKPLRVAAVVQLMPKNTRKTSV